MPTPRMKIKNNNWANPTNWTRNHQ